MTMARPGPSPSVTLLFIPRSSARATYSFVEAKYVGVGSWGGPHCGAGERGLTPAPEANNKRISLQNQPIASGDRSYHGQLPRPMRAWRTRLDKHKFPNSSRCQDQQQSLRQTHWNDTWCT